MLIDLGHRRHLCGGAGEEDLRERSKLVGYDRPLDDLVAAPLAKPDHRAPRDAVEEAVGIGRVDDAILDEEDVGARALRDAPAPVEHERIRKPCALRTMLLDGADHVEARGLALRRRS